MIKNHSTKKKEMCFFLLSSTLLGICITEIDDSKNKEYKANYYKNYKNFKYLNNRE